jgi:hypothetical protein
MTAGHSRLIATPKKPKNHVHHTAVMNPVARGRHNMRIDVDAKTPGPGAW